MDNEDIYIPTDPCVNHPDRKATHSSIYAGMGDLCTACAFHEADTFGDRAASDSNKWAVELAIA